MIILQIVTGMIVPIIMIVFGRKLAVKNPEYMDEGLAYKSSRAKRSEETWRFANMLFSRMILAIGANLAVIACIFILAAVLAADVNGWILAVLMMIFEVVFLIIPVYITELFIDKNYDENGVLIEEPVKKKKKKKRRFF